MVTFFHCQKHRLIRSLEELEKTVSFTQKLLHECVVDKLINDVMAEIY